MGVDGKTKGKDISGLKLIHMVKLNSDRLFQMSKATLVAKAYAQQSGINFNETFALLVRC